MVVPAYAFDKESTVMVITFDTFHTKNAMARFIRPIYPTSLTIQSLLINFLFLIFKQSSRV